MRTSRWREPDGDPGTRVPFPRVPWVFLFSGLVVVDGVLLMLWLGGTALDEDCEEVERTPEDATGSDWACTELIQDVGPYAIVPLVLTLGLTTFVVIREAQRAKR
jgi:hypothetical protein